MDMKSISHKQSCEVRPWLMGISILCEGCNERYSCFSSAGDSNRETLELGNVLSSQLEGSKQDPPRQK